MGKPEVSIMTPWKGAVVCCLTNTLTYQVLCSVLCVRHVLPQVEYAAFAEPVVGSNAMIKTVYCRLCGGYDDLHIVLRGGNVGLCSIPPLRDNLKRTYSLRRGHGLPLWDPVQAKGLAPGWQLLWRDLGGPRWQSIAATRPGTSARCGGSGLCRFAGAWGWCCGPWPPAPCQGAGGFAPALSSQRAQDCP